MNSSLGLVPVESVVWMVNVVRIDSALTSLRPSLSSVS